MVLVSPPVVLVTPPVVLVTPPVDVEVAPPLVEVEPPLVLEPPLEVEVDPPVLVEVMTMLPPLATMRVPEWRTVPAPTDNAPSSSRWRITPGQIVAPTSRPTPSDISVECGSRIVTP